MLKDSPWGAPRRPHLSEPWIKRSLGQILPRLLAAVMLVTGCAARHPYSPPPPEQCHPAADAAISAGEWEKALADHQQLLVREPGNCLAEYHLGFIWGRLGNREQEIHRYEKAITCGRVADDQLYFNLAMAYADKGELERAIEAFERGSAINPGNPDLYFGLGLVYLTADDSEKAENSLLKALGADPPHMEAAIALVRLYLKQGRWEEAQQQLDTIDRIDPENEEARELRQTWKERRAIEYNR